MKAILTSQNPTAEEVKFDDGESFQDKLNNGSLKGQDGADGKDGAPGGTGPQGPAGPNTVSTTTTTNITGILKGDGAHVAQAVAGTDYLPPTRKVNSKALSADITLSAADVKALPLAGGTMTGNIAMGSHKVTGLATPTATTDAATKGYVDWMTVPIGASMQEKQFAGNTSYSARLQYSGYEYVFIGNILIEFTADNTTFDCLIPVSLARGASEEYYVSAICTQVTMGSPRKICLLSCRVMLSADEVNIGYISVSDINGTTTKAFTFTFGYLCGIEKAIP